MRWYTLLAVVLGSTPGLSGCGLVLDLEPPVERRDGALMDASAAPDDAGMDGGITDARVRRDANVECEGSAECDDGVYCNGLERCELGRCTPGTAVECSDGLACTVDTCDEMARACSFIPDDGLCVQDGDPACVLRVCNPLVGCMPEFRHALCDDGLSCTGEICLETGCETGPGEPCDPSMVCSELGPGPTGCVPEDLSCGTDGECVRLCHLGTCTAGACTFVPVAFDPECGRRPGCAPSTCEAGRCSDAVVCGDTPSLSTCTVNMCVVSESGSAHCETVARRGVCAAGPCEGGTCNRTPGVCTPTRSCVSDPCTTRSCTADNSCIEAVAMDCGSGSICDLDEGCVCRPGFEECGGSCCPAPDAGTDGGRPEGGPPEAGPPEAGISGDAGLEGGTFTTP